MKKFFASLFVMLVAAAGLAQQPQVPLSPATPISNINTKYVQGVGIGYWPTVGSGLLLDVTAGTSFCNGSIANYSGGTVSLAANTTTYVFIDPSSSCSINSNTSGFSSATIPIASVTTNGSAITAIADVRTEMVNNFATPPVIGGTTPNQIYGTTITGGTIIASSSLEATYLSNGCLQVASGVVISTGSNCGAGGGGGTVSSGTAGNLTYYSATGNTVRDTAAITVTGSTSAATVTINNLDSSNVALTGGTINGTSVGASSASTGAFTTLSASGAVSGSGFSTYLASPPAIGGTAANSGAFTTLRASGAVSGSGFSTYLASPPAIGGTAANTIQGTTITATSALKDTALVGNDGCLQSSGGTITSTGTSCGSGSGSVTSVIASSPLSSSGGATPNISISSSTGSGAVVLASGPSIANPTFTGSITTPLTSAAGIVVNNSSGVLGTTPTVSIANGGTGTASPSGVSGGTNITVTGSFPSQTVAITNDSTSVNGQTCTLGGSCTITAAATAVSGCSTAGLATTTSGGVLSCEAVPTWNQTTTGSAASLSISGQTGVLTFTGLTSTNRTKTVRDAADTILELAGSYTPTGTWNWTSASVTWPTFNQNTSGTAANITASSNSTLTTLSSLSLPYSQVTGTPTLGTWSTLNYPTYVSGTPFVKMTAAGTFSLDTNTYLTANQSITLSGIITGSGTTSITTSAGSGYYMPTTTDESNWNGKQSALTNPVTGPGSGATVGHFAAMGNTSGTTITDSGYSYSSFDTAGAAAARAATGSCSNQYVTATTTSGVTCSALPVLTMNTSGTGLSGSTTYNGSGIATFTVTSNATNANTASTVVARDSSGNFTAGTITATLSGNATNITASSNSTLTTLSSLSLPYSQVTGTPTSLPASSIIVGTTTVSSGTNGYILYDNSGILGNLATTGSGNVVRATSPSISGLTVTSSFTATGLVTNADLTNSTISGVALGSNLNTLTFGTHLAAGGSSYNGSSAVTITSDATNADTVSTIVARDSSGNFSAGTITATLSGNATNITASSNTSLTSLSNLVTVGTITSGQWSAGQVDSTGSIISSINYNGLINIPSSGVSNNYAGFGWNGIGQYEMSFWNAYYTGSPQTSFAFYANNSDGYYSVATISSTGTITADAFSGNGSALSNVISLHPISFADMSNTVYTASQIIAEYISPVAQTLPTNLTTSTTGVTCAPQAKFTTANTSSIVLTVKYNGTSIGTITIGSSNGSLTTSTSSQAVAAGGIITIVAPSSPDATAAGLYMSACAYY